VQDASLNLILEKVAARLVNVVYGGSVAAAVAGQLQRPKEKW